MAERACAHCGEPTPSAALKPWRAQEMREVAADPRRPGLLQPPGKALLPRTVSEVLDQYICADCFEDAEHHQRAKEGFQKSFILFLGALSLVIFIAMMVLPTVHDSARLFVHPDRPWREADPQPIPPNPKASPLPSSTPPSRAQT